MPLYNEGFGSALGDALGGFTTQYIGTQNTLKQQDLQRQQQEADNAYRQRQAAADEAYRQQQAAEQRRQFDVVQNVNGVVHTTETRQKDMQTLAPDVNTFVTQMEKLAQQYGPTSGASYSPALYESYKTRAKAATQAWATLSKAISSGEGYDEARSALMTATGIGTPGAPVTGTPASAPIPAPMNMNFTPPAAPVQTTVAHGDAVANGDTAPQGPPAPAQPAAPAAPAGLPADVRSIRPSDLVDIPDDQLLARYGEGGLEYAVNTRTQYKAQQAAARTLVIKAQNSMWADVIKNLPQPATPAQLRAANILTTYGAFQEAGQDLTPEQKAEYDNAVTTLAPAVYTAATWQKVLDTKDPAIIAGSYNTYLKVAPEVVAGFDVTPFQAAVTDAHNAAVTDIDLKHSTILKNTTDGTATAQTTNLRGILGGADNLGEVISKKDTATLRALATGPKSAESLALLGITDGGAGLMDIADRLDAGEDAALLVQTTQAGQNVAQTDKAVADTGKVVADTGKVKFDQGVATLGQLAGTGATIYQLQHDGSNTWFNLKQQLHLSDAELAAVYQQARWEADQKSRGIVLANDYKSSQILTDGAQRAQAIANTADTLSTTRARDAELQPRLDLLNQQIVNAQLQGQDTTSLIRERNTLLPVKVQQGLAAAAASRANTTETLTTLPGKVALQNSTLQVNAAQIGNMASEIASRNRRDQAYVSSVAGQLKVDTARIGQITADTALTRLKVSNPELFRSSGQPGDPMDALKKRAGLNYTAADQALRQAQALQTQLNSMQPKVDAFGNVIGTPADPAKVASLTTQRDKLMQRAINQRNLGDKVIQNGLPGAITPNTGTGDTGQPVVTYQQLGSSLGLPTARTGTPYGQAYGPNGSWGIHNGDDIFAPVGTPIKAPFTGYVSVKHSETTGNEVILTDANGQKMLLGHLQGYPAGLQDAITKAGGRLLVQAGQKVGMVGQTGTLAHSDIAGNSHTHVMAYDASGKVVNPLSVKFVSVQGPGPTQTAGKPPPTTPVKVSTGTALPNTPASAMTGGKWGPPQAALPTGVKAVGSITQYAQDLRQRGWFARAAQAKSREELMGLINQAAKYALPTGTSEQRIAFQRDLFDSMAGLQ